MVQRPNFDALEREMADIKARVIELEKFLPLSRQPIKPLLIRDMSRFVGAITKDHGTERSVVDLCPSVTDGA